VGKPEGKKPVEEQRCSRRNNIKMDYRQDDFIWNELIWIRTETAIRLQA
jgi:hypothetical protein